MRKVNILIILVVVLLSSCRTTKIVYTQNGRCVIGTVVEDERKRYKQKRLKADNSAFFDGSGCFADNR